MPLKASRIYNCIIFIGRWAGWASLFPIRSKARRPRSVLAATLDLIEEQLFAQRRDLFTTLELVFFDTTSIYFEGAGGESLGQYGHSKDHRPDLKQMVVGVVLDSAGRPICCEELQARLEAAGSELEWVEVIADLEALEDVEVVHQQKHFRLRTETKGTCGEVFQAVGVALPPTVRQIKEVAPT